MPAARSGYLGGLGRDIRIGQFATSHADYVQDNEPDHSNGTLTPSLVYSSRLRTIQRSHGWPASWD